MSLEVVRSWLADRVFPFDLYISFLEVQDGHADREREEKCWDSEFTN
jgi:hypothetical protein